MFGLGFGRQCPEAFRIGRQMIRSEVRITPHHAGDSQPPNSRSANSSASRAFQRNRTKTNDRFRAIWAATPDRLLLARTRTVRDRFGRPWIWFDGDIHNAGLHPTNGPLLPPNLPPPHRATQSTRVATPAASPASSRGRCFNGATPPNAIRPVV
jgi:hypothetical protein